MILAALAVACAAAAAEPAPRKVSFPTADGWTISADYLAPRKGGVVLILAHGVAASKSEWGEFAVKLASAGVGSLAIDLRGHQDSQKGPKGRRDFTDFDSTGEWPRAVADFEAAARWLKGRGVASKRIAYGGASIGANLASQAAARAPDAPFLVLLSPGPDYHGVTLMIRRDLTTFVAASKLDGYAYQTLEPLSKIGSIRTAEATHGHGAQMFEDRAFLEKLVAWVAARR